MNQFILWRKKNDGFLLATGVALLPFDTPARILVFAAFAIAGCYLLAFRPRTWRHVDRSYLAAALAYGLAAVTIAFFHGDLAEDFRWVSYPLYFPLTACLLAGWTLVADPLRQCSIGARAGIVLAVLLAFIEYFQGAPRIGLGTNPANKAFVIMTLVVLARMTVVCPPALLPNSRLWTYLASIAVLMTGTRIMAIVLVIILMLDLLALRKENISILTWLRGRRLGTATVLAGIILFIPVVAVPMISERLNYTISEFTENETRDTGVNGLERRLVMWGSAANIIADNPLFGLGGNASMAIINDTLQQAFPDAPPYRHAHNLVLDEMRIRGLLGFGLMVLFFAVAFSKIIQRGNVSTAEVTGLFALLMVTYGSVHGVLMADSNVALIAIFLCAGLAHVRNGLLNFRGRTH